MDWGVVITDGFGEVAELLLLLLVEFGRDLHLDGDVEVAFLASGKGGYAFVADAEGGAALGARWDLDRGLTVKCRHLEFSAEGCGAERQGDVAEQRGALALEDVVLLDVEEGV